jgi:Domain of unknown function (DUF1707)
VVSGFEMRVSDAERDAVAAELREHFASGRLTQDELNERLDQAFAAKTRGDLHPLMTDLPSAQAWWAADGHGHDWQRHGHDWQRHGHDWQRHGHDWQRGGRQAAGALVGSFVMLWALLAVGLVAIFGLGGGRPFGIALLIAAFALLRRLIIGIFRRRRAGSRGPRRRR